MKNGSAKISGRANTTAATTTNAAHWRGPVWASIGSRTLYLLYLFLSHESGRAQGEDEENDQEGDPFLEIGVDDAEELLEQPDDEAADQDADGVLETAEDRGREGLDAGHGAHVGPGEGDGRDEDAAQPRQRRGDHEGEHDHALDIDAHDGGGVAVEGDGGERLAEHRALEEDLDEQHGADGGHDDEELLGEDTGGAHAQDGVAEGRGELDLLRPPNLDGGVLEDDADGDGAEHPGQRQRVAQHGADGHALEPDPHEADEDDGARDRDAIGQAQRDVAGEAEQGAHHQELALAEVEGARGDEGDVVALGDQRVDAADRQAADHGLPELDEEGFHLIRADELAVLPDGQEAALAPHGLVVVRRVRPRLHLGRRVAEVADLLERVTNLLGVGTHAVQGAQDQTRAVIGLRRGHGMEVSALVLEALLDLGVELLGVLAVVRRVGGDGHDALDRLLAAELEEVGGDQGPRRGPGDPELDLRSEEHTSELQSR